MTSIFVANAKGGCGKTTIATTIAAALAASGADVALTDADPQRSSLTWLSRRPPNARLITPFDGALSRAASKADAQAAEIFQWRVTDGCAGFDDPRTAAAVESADVILAPVCPSLFDAQTTRGFLMRLENLARARRSDTEILVVANRLRARSRATRALLSSLERLEIAVAAEISDRAAYADLAARGLSIFDRRAKALEPLRAQWRPLLNALAAPSCAPGAGDRAPRAA